MKNDRSSDLSFFVINNDMEYNYIEVSKDYMPTKGIGYDPNAKIEARLLTIGDIKLLSMITPETQTQIYKEILRRCCRFTNMTLDELYLADRDFLLFWIRSGSFARANGFVLSSFECPYCKHTNDVQLQLEAFDLDFAKCMTKTIKLRNVDVTFTLPKINDKLVSLKDKEIESIINYTDLMSTFKSVQECAKFLLTLDGFTYLKFINTLRHFKCGIKDEVTFECPSCKKQIKANLPLKESDLMPRIPIEDILQLIISICKYCNFQISDDMIYVEVELMRVIVENMLKEEQKAYESANGFETLTNYR